jgi:ubiquinone/menaquinone biosynthesis C-methylase UbiE
MFDSTFKKGDAEDPPFEAGTFDVVVTRHLLYSYSRFEQKHMQM